MLLREIIALLFFAKIIKFVIDCVEKYVHLLSIKEEVLLVKTALEKVFSIKLTKRIKNGNTPYRSTTYLDRHDARTAATYLVQY